MSRTWGYVVVTCSLELLWVFGFKIAESWWEWLFVVLLIGLDFYFLMKACEKLPTGTVYAIFSAVGTSGTVLLDSFYFHIPLTFWKLFFLTCLLGGVISLRLADEKASEGGT